MDGRHVMLDIEALSTAQDCVIVSIGATTWHEPTRLDLGEAFDLKILVNIAKGQEHRRIDGSNIMWWMKQSQAARDANFEGGERAPLKEALSRLYNWAKGTDHYWAWPASYDLSAIDNAYRGFGMEPPWGGRHRRLHCARTLCLAEGIKREPNPLKHDPLEDARVQMVAVKRALEKRRWTRPSRKKR